jgi:hypothetical protein
VARKSYYSNEINNIAEMIAFTPNKKSVDVLGSMSIRSQVWASDYDLLEKVNMSSLTLLVKRYKDIVRNLLKQKHIYIGDIKLGNIVDWRILDDRAFFVNGKLMYYNAEQSRAKLRELLDKGVITKSFYDKGSDLLVDNPTPSQLRVIIKELRPNIQRWKPSEILTGYKILPTGKRYSVADAMTSPGVFKMDTIALLSDGIFQEISIVYDLRIKGKRINDFPYSVQDSLLQDIEFYSATGSWFKVLKRLFSLANYRYANVSSGKEKQIDLIEKIHPILVSDIGILYQVYGDVGAIVYLLKSKESIPMERIKSEIDEFINRLSNVYSVNEYIQKEPEIVSKINGILKMKSREKMAELLGELEKVMETIINDETKKRMNEIGLAMLRRDVGDAPREPNPRQVGGEPINRPPPESLGSSGGGRNSGLVQGVFAGKPAGEWTAPIGRAKYDIRRPKTLSKNLISRDPLLTEFIELIDSQIEYDHPKNDKSLYFNPYHKDNRELYNMIIENLRPTNRYRARTLYDRLLAGRSVGAMEIKIPETNDKRQIRKNAYNQAFRQLRDTKETASADEFDRLAESIYNTILERKGMERGGDYAFEYAKNRYGDIAPGKPRPTP